MNAQTLLDSLQARGAVVTTDGARLWVEPREVLTDSDRDAIRELKPQLLELLESGVPVGTPDEVPPSLEFVFDEQAGLWHRGPWIMPTVATLPAYREYWERKQSNNRFNELEAAA